MRQVLATRSIEIPEGVTLSVKARQVKVEGPRGKMTRTFKHIQVDMYLTEEDGVRKLRVDTHFGKRKELAGLRTITSHVQNMITGVTKGFEYKMRLVYAHFPINVLIENSNHVKINNFLGEKRVRKVAMLGGVSIERNDKVKDELVLAGNDVEAVSRSAALIHQSCLVRAKDIRKFLDGIYVSEKGTVIKDEE